MSGPWPTSPLQAAQRAFQLLTCPPQPLALDCTGIPRLPQRLVPLDELRRRGGGDARADPDGRAAGHRVAG